MVAEIVLITLGGDAEAGRQSAQYVARGLSAIGHKVREQISVCESGRQLQQAVAKALGRSHIMVTLGGLGRDAGYIAKNTIAQGLGLPLELNNDALAAMRSYCHRTGETYSLEDNELAKLPRGSAPFPGSYGKIPGCVISSAKQHIIMLPENSAEIIPMFNRYVSPYLGGKATTTVTRTVRTYGVGEKHVRETLGGLLNTANPAVTVHREQNEVLVRVSAHAETAAQAAALCTPVLRAVADKMGDAAYGLDVESLQSALVTKLNKKEVDIAVAESGTGGMLTRVITETEGGQEALRYSVAVDDNESKAEKLGLHRKRLKKRGGVSEYAAVQMAVAAREKVHTGIGIGVTASTSENETRKCPAGVVYIAVCDARNVYVKKLVVGEGDALDDTIVDAALSRALNMARLFVDYLPEPYPGTIPLAEALDGKTVTERDSYVEDCDVTGRTEEESGGPARPGKRQTARRIVFTVAVIVFISCLVYLGYTAYQSYQAGRVQDALNNMFGDVAIEDIPEDYPKEFKNLKFAALWNENQDVRGFINIPGTTVSYPVVQKYDNEYYLRRDFYGNSNQYGVPFFDFRVDVAKPSDNMVVYGHNMTDGKIFGELINYKELDYYKEHPLINFSTVYEDAKYKVFSVFITNAYKNQGHVFDYYNFIEAESDRQSEAFLEQLRYRSLIETPVDVQPGDKLLTLSTCSYELKDMRTVIVARKVRSGESDAVNVEAAAKNPSPLYPDIWYEKLGGTPPEGVDPYWSVGQNASEYMGYQGDSTAPAVSTMASSRSASGGNSVSTVENLEEWASERAESRRAESSRLAEESSRQAEERRRQAEAAEQARLASEAVEQSRLASEAAEQSRLAEESRLASEAAEQARLASEAAEQSRLASEAAEQSRLAEESRLASEAAEQSRLAAEEANRTAATPQASAMSYRRSGGGQLTVKSNGSQVTDDALTVVAKIVQNEMGASFNTEAIKAQAVATYSYIAHQNAAGITPSVYMTESVSGKVQNAVAEVIGRAVTYGGQVAFTPYHATSAGMTTSSSTVWGGSYSYLVPVDSSVDKQVNGYRYSITMSRSEVENRLSSRLGIQVSGNPGGWFEILNRDEGGYIGSMRVCGQSKSGSGTAITGRVMRETVLNLRSANFEIGYDSGSDQFTFTTYGYGHGVGMSQNGANAYAAQGWSYVDILEHYYPGTAVQ